MGGPRAVKFVVLKTRGPFGLSTEGTLQARLWQRGVWGDGARSQSDQNAPRICQTIVQELFQSSKIGSLGLGS